MININRSLRPDKDWSFKSYNLVKDLVKSFEVIKKTKRLNYKLHISNHYRNLKVKRLLQKEFFEKCAYCEKRLNEFTFDIEHYRPKGSFDPVNHPRPKYGYFWLAYNWHNLFPSCEQCNRKTTLIDDIGNRTNITFGKLNEFPLKISSILHDDPNDEFGHYAEDPLILNPCDFHNVETHFIYEPSGHVRPRNNSEEARETIRIFSLNARQELVSRRRRKILEVVDVCKVFIELSTCPGDHVAAESHLISYLNRACSAESEFAGVARFVINNPIMFGLSKDIPFRGKIHY